MNKTYLSFQGEHQTLNVLSGSKGLQQAIVEVIVAVQACEWNKMGNRDVSQGCYQSELRGRLG